MRICPCAMFDPHFQVYLFGPLLGAAAAVPLYNFVLCPCGE